MKVSEVLLKTTQFFKQKGLPSARLDSELLISHALGWNRVDLYLKSDYPISNDELDRCRDLVRRRASGEPVAYVFGEKEFYNRTFEVNSDVLIPRPETEHLVDEALALVKASPQDEPFKIVDMGVGSGCIGLTLLCEIPHSQLVGVDLSEPALKVAGRNAERLGVESRVRFYQQSAETLSREQVEGEAHLVVANPPYVAPDDPNLDVNVRKFEPNLALFSPGDGTEHARAWLQTARHLLRAGGWVLLEIGADQGPVVLGYCREMGGFENAQLIRDYSGRDRVLKATRAKEGNNG